MLLLALLDCDTPDFVSDLFVGTEGQWVFFYFSHCNSLPVFLIYTLVHLGSTRGATCCLNSQFAIGELLRRAAEFTLGGQGPLLFAWVQREHLGHPPTRIHRPHISDSTESSCNNKLPFCQTACTHNKREKGPLRHVVTQKIVLVPSQFFGCIVSKDGLPTAVLRRSSFRAPPACLFQFLQCQSHYSCFTKDPSVLTMATWMF